MKERIAFVFAACFLTWTAIAQEVSVSAGFVDCSQAGDQDAIIQCQLQNAQLGQMQNAPPGLQQDSGTQ